MHGGNRSGKKIISIWINGMMKRFFSFFVCYCSFIGAHDLSPWMKNELEMRSYAEYTFQSFDRVETFCKNKKYCARDHFLSLGLGSSIFQWSGNVEIVGAKTKRQDYNIDNLNLSLTKHVYSDVIGDPFALAMGVKVIQAFKNSLHDVSSFHHGQFEVEFHLSAGKECSPSSYWLNRYWVLGAVGQADRGYPWLRGAFVLEKQWWPKHRMTFLTEVLVGTGKKEINICNFVGYGPIAHRSIDVTIQYHYLMDCALELAISYAYRPYSRNFPENAQIFTVAVQNALSPVDFFLSRWLLSGLGKSK